MSDVQENLWQTHSMKFLEAAFRTDRQEALFKADGRGKKTGDCGDTIEFFIILKDNRIQNMGYQLQGCINTNACANALITLAEGRTLAEAWEIRPEEVAAALESLPGDHFHCAELAVGAFYLALSDARRTMQAPWKKPYQQR